MMAPVVLMCIRIFFVFITIVLCNSLYAQERRVIVVVEPGELADTVSVWGDIKNEGRYAIPRQSSVLDVLQYGRGVRTLRDQQISVGLSRVRVEVSVFSKDQYQERRYADKFIFYYDRPFPAGLTTYKLKNHDIIYISVRKEPSLIELIRIIAPILSGIATLIALANRF